MIKRESQWECKPCQDSSEKSSNICMVCGYPSSGKSVKITKKNGRHAVKYNIEK